MKREINCPPCAREWSEAKCDRCESIKYTAGLVCFELSDIRCDQCNVPLPRGALAVAVSVWKNDLLDGYHAWEHAYLEPVSCAEADAIERLSSPSTD